MRAVLLGGTGFIGRHLAATLTERGWRLITIGRSGGTIRTDAHNINAYREALTHADIIFNLVGKRADDEATNVELVRKLLLTLQQVNRRALFVQFGTRLEYGRQERLPVPETATCRPEEPYAKQKLRAEKLCEASPLRTLRLRLATVYGGGGKGIVNHILTTLQRGETFTIHGTGDHIKDFIHVSDVISGILSLITTTGTYNIGSGERLTFKEAVAIIHKHVGKGVVTFDETKGNKDPPFLADNTKLKKRGWQPMISFAKGIQQLLEGNV